MLGEVVAQPGGGRVEVYVPTTLKYLAGHFPGNPVVPGIAQLVLVERTVKRVFPDLGAPRSLSRLKFEARIDPGDDLLVTVERTDEKVRFTIVRGETSCSRGTFTY